MTPEEIALIQYSYAKVWPREDEFAAQFYKKLFAAQPEIASLFKGDMVLQGRKLTTMLGAIVNGLDSFSIVVQAAEEMALRHVDYGVKIEHYDYVGVALIGALDSLLGKECTPDIMAAWAKIYRELSVKMIAAASSAEAA